MKGHSKDKWWTLHPHLKAMKLSGMGQTSTSVAGSATSGNDVVRNSDLDGLIEVIAKLTESSKDLSASKFHKPIIINFGATHNMISDPKLLSNVKPRFEKVTIANGHDISIRKIGDLELNRRKQKICSCMNSPRTCYQFRKRLRILIAWLFLVLMLCGFGTLSRERPLAKVVQRMTSMFWIIQILLLALLCMLVLVTSFQGF